MKVYRIKRLTPTTGMIEALQWNGLYRTVTDEIPYKDCKRYIADNQEDIKTYRIAEYANRKDASRHLLMTIYAYNEAEAMSLFCYIDLQSPKRRRELLSGDWKIITTNYTEMR